MTEATNTGELFWAQEMADAIETAENGDTIMCHSVELGERARVRLAPDKPLRFEVEGVV